jgi:hypothetical protein
MMRTKSVSLECFAGGTLEASIDGVSGFHVLPAKCYQLTLIDGHLGKVG